MATEAVTLDKDAFMRLVTQEHLQVEGPSAGYLYTGKQGKNGWELYKTPNNPWFMQQGRYVLTQNAGGGGALTIRVSCPSGQVARLVDLMVTGTASAGATLTGLLLDEDGATAAEVGALTAGAARRYSLPNQGAAGVAQGGHMSTQDLILGPGQILSFTSSAALQTETMTLAFAFLTSNNSPLVVDSTGSAGTPGLGANTISAANALVQVPLI